MSTLALAHAVQVADLVILAACLSKNLRRLREQS